MESYLFRFRDLGQKLGFTIDEHQTVGDYTWWGWWAKNGEKFPTNDLACFVEEAPQTIFLFDSGQYKFYKAELLAVYGAPSGTINKEAPENGDRTPSYYKEYSLLGWLKLQKIEAIDDAKILGSMSYIPLDGMFDSGSDRNSQLFNKIVFSSNELRSQDRTIWKIRSKAEGDSLHEAIATHYAPVNFSERYAQKDSEQILWLSDIHFDDGQSGKHSFPINNDEQKKNLLTRVRELVEHTTEGDKRCAGMFISGDVSWQSQPEGFESAGNFVNDLKSMWELTSEDIAICPGNHDLGLMSPDEYFSSVGRLESKENWKELATGYNQKCKENYINFYKSVFGISPENDLSQGRKFLLGGSRIVEVASLNSCILQQISGGFQGIGFIGEAQLDNVAKNLGWGNVPKKTNVVRIAMLHHHLIPVNETEDARLNTRYSVTADGERLIRWVIQHEIDYVIHGHMHRSFNATLIRARDPQKIISKDNKEHTFQIIALGSSGVSADNLPPEDRKNQVCIIDFSKDKPIFKFYALNPNNADYQALYEVEGKI